MWTANRAIASVLVIKLRKLTLPLPRPFCPIPTLLVAMPDCFPAIFKHGDYLMTNLYPDPFSDLSKLRLDQNYLETAGVKKLLRTVPVRKPGAQDFVRTHPDRRLTAALIELTDDRETYLVTPQMVPELPGEYFPAALFLTITRQGVLTLWPVRLPSPDGKHLEWHRSAMEAAEAAQTKWIKIRANMGLGAYDIFEAENVSIPDPTWPSESFEEIVRVAFRDRFVDSADHAVIKRLRGQL
jgi:hypothetical protein